MVKLAHNCNFGSCLDDLQNITIKVFFFFLHAASGISMARKEWQRWCWPEQWMEGSFCVFETCNSLAQWIWQKNNEEVNKLWIFNQDLNPCLTMVSNFLGSENTYLTINWQLRSWSLRKHLNGGIVMCCSLSAPDSTHWLHQSIDYVCRNKIRHNIWQNKIIA